MPFEVYVFRYAFYVWRYVFFLAKSCIVLSIFKTGRIMKSPEFRLLSVLRLMG
jgi:hypothetical protein